MGRRSQQAFPGVDEVIAQQDRERFVAYVLGRAQDRVPQAEGLALANVVHQGDLAGPADAGKPFFVALRRKNVL